MDNDLDKRIKEENLAQANIELKAAIERTLDKSFGELTIEDKEFLYSRRNYLSRDKRSEYKNVFKQVEGWHEEKAKKEAEEAARNPILTNDEPKGHPADLEENDDDGEDEVG